MYGTAPIICCYMGTGIRAMQEFKCQEILNYGLVVKITVNVLSWLCKSHYIGFCGNETCCSNNSKCLMSWYTWILWLQSIILSLDKQICYKCIVANNGCPQTVSMSYCNECTKGGAQTVRCLKEIRPVNHHQWLFRWNWSNLTQLVIGQYNKKQHKQKKQQLDL